MKNIYEKRLWYSIFASSMPFFARSSFSKKSQKSVERYIKLSISTGLGLYSEVHFHAKYLLIIVDNSSCRGFLIGMHDTIKDWTPDRVGTNAFALFWISKIFRIVRYFLRQTSPILLLPPKNHSHGATPLL